jgi:hypothetical protein
MRRFAQRSVLPNEKAPGNGGFCLRAGSIGRPAGGTWKHVLSRGAIRVALGRLARTGRGAHGVRGPPLDEAANPEGHVDARMPRKSHRGRRQKIAPRGRPGRLTPELADE